MANKVERVWQKANPIWGKNPNSWRRDKTGKKIRFGSYGTTGVFGWEIDHRYPQSKGGSNHPRNLQPLHWLANRRKSDKIKK